ncbi:MAG: hypothetical protein KDD33_08705 [Bdellovibrionales bacterium]|nr:hypothetical protein [Bdellovibrionales bacterium]
MKALLALILTLVTFSSFAAELKDSKKREMVCKQIGMKFNEQATACKNGSLEIVGVAKATVVNKSVSQEYTTLMTIEASFNDKTYSAQMKKGVSIDDLGQIVLAGWEVTKVELKSKGDQAILKETFMGNYNTTELNLIDVPQNIQKVSAIEMGPDFDDISFYEVFKTKAKKESIGYIAYDSICGDEEDPAAMCVGVTVWLDINANIVKTDSEEWGVNE